MYLTLHKKGVIILRMLPFFKPKKGFQLAGSGFDAGSGGGGGGSIDTSVLANKTDLTAIILTGTTNTSGDVISAGTWFYLNGKPCIAKVDIASGATFTEGTNYEEKTIGSALSELNGKFVHIPNPAITLGSNIDSSSEIDIIIIGQVAFVTFNVYTINAVGANTSLDIGEENLPQHRYACGSIFQGSNGEIISMYSGVNHHLYIPLKQGCGAGAGFYGSIAISLL